LLLHFRGLSGLFRLSMASSKLFVANLHFTTTIEKLNELFGAFGEVLEIRIAKDNDGKSKGNSSKDAPPETLTLILFSFDSM
jgi:hypothetical protein